MYSTGSLFAISAHERNVDFLGAGVKLDQRPRRIVVLESNRVLVLAPQSNVFSAFVFSKNEPGLLERGVGQLPVERVIVPFGGNPHRRESAMQKKPAVRPHVIGCRVRLAEHRLHRNVPPAKGGGPDLLSLKGQHNNLAGAVCQQHRLDTAIVAEKRSAEFPPFPGMAASFLKRKAAANLLLPVS